MAKDMTSAGFKCPRCGQPLPEGSRFCLVCGVSVESAAKAADPAGESGDRNDAEDRTEKAAAGSVAGETRGPGPAAGRSHRPMLTLFLLALLIGGIALIAYGLSPAAGGGGGEIASVRPLARAGIGSDGQEMPLDPTDATGEGIGTETVEEPLPEGGGNPPTTGITSPVQALAATFELAEDETIAPCSTGDFAATLCYLPYLTNLEQERYLYQVGLPFSEPFAWALVEQQGDGTFETTQTADFDFEGDGTPPFSPGGTMAGVTFTNEVLDGRPVDQLDDGINPLLAGASEAYVFVRYIGLQASDQLAVSLAKDGSPLGEPVALGLDPGAESSVALRIIQGDGAEIPLGTYTATLLLNGTAIARGSVAVVAG